MRFRVLAAVWFAVCGALQLLAQAAPAALLPPPPPKPTAAPKARHATPLAPPAIFDATGLGSPLLLDKNWRVGITSDLAASTPAFDDSAWAIRNAQAVINDVPDEDDDHAATPPKSRSAQSAATRHESQRAALRLVPSPHQARSQSRAACAAHRTAGLARTPPSVSAPRAQPRCLRQRQPDPARGPARQRAAALSAHLPHLRSQRAGQRNLAHARGARPLHALRLRRIHRLLLQSHFYLGNPADLQRELNLWSDRSLFERLPRLDLLRPPRRPRDLSLRSLFCAERPHRISLAGPA